MFKPQLGDKVNYDNGHEILNGYIVGIVKKDNRSISPITSVYVDFGFYREKIEPTQLSLNRTGLSHKLKLDVGTSLILASDNKLQPTHSFLLHHVVRTDNNTVNDAYDYVLDSLKLYTRTISNILKFTSKISADCNKLYDAKRIINKFFEYANSSIIELGKYYGSVLDNDMRMKIIKTYGRMVNKVEKYYRMR